MVAQDPKYEGLLPERVAPLVLSAQQQFSFSHIVGPSSANRYNIEMKFVEFCLLYSFSINYSRCRIFSLLSSFF